MSKGIPLLTISLILALCVAMLAGLQASTVGTAAAHAYLCSDLDAAAKRICTARVQCKSVTRQLAIASRHYCECLASRRTGASEPSALHSELDLLTFACCTGNAINLNPNLCEKF